MTAPYPEFDGSQPCASVNPDLFFPPPGSTGVSDHMRDLCDPCPFNTACLAYAVDRPWIDGWWAATNSNMRQAIRADRRAGAA